MKTYTETDIKLIYADLIERMGCDVGAVCNWSGADSVSLETWEKAWWQAFVDTCEHEKDCGRYLERNRIAQELIRLNEKPLNL